MNNDLFSKRFFRAGQVALSRNDTGRGDCQGFFSLKISVYFFASVIKYKSKNKIIKILKTFAK